MHRMRLQTPLSTIHGKLELMAETNIDETPGPGQIEDMHVFMVGLARINRSR